MTMGLKFYIGAGLALVGIILMSLPDRPCVDCGDEVTVETDAIYIDTETEVPGD
jgi:hypothetical protein